MIQMLLTNQIENSKSKVAHVRPEIQRHKGLPRRFPERRVDGNIVPAIDEYLVIGPPLSFARNLHRQAGIQGMFKIQPAVKRLIKYSALDLPIPFTNLELRRLWQSVNNAS